MTISVKCDWSGRCVWHCGHAYSLLKCECRQSWGEWREGLGRVRRPRGIGVGGAGGGVAGTPVQPHLAEDVVARRAVHRSVDDLPARVALLMKLGAFRHREPWNLVVGREAELEAERLRGV